MENIKPVKMMAEIKRKDDWFYVLLDAIKMYEEEYRCTPSETELWLSLDGFMPESYFLEAVGKNKIIGYHVHGGKYLSRQSFRKRYRRLFPSSDDENEKNNDR